MKMNQLKKMLSITLAAAMLVTSIPFGSIAEENTAVETTETTAETAAATETTEAAGGETVATEAPVPTETTKATEATEAPTPEETAGGTDTAKNGGDTGAAESANTPGSTDTTETGAKSAGDTGTENSETPGETAPAPSEDTQNPAPVENSAGQDAQSSGKESDGASNGTQETSADSAQGAPQAGESAPGLENASGEGTNENIPAKITSYGKTKLDISTVTLEWDIPESGEWEWNNTIHKPVAKSCTGYEGSIEDLNLTYEYTEKEGGDNSSEPGEYTVTATVGEGKRKEVTLDNATANFTIIKKKLNSGDFTWYVNDEEQTGDTLTATYTGSEIKPTAKFKETKSGALEEVTIEKTPNEPATLPDGKIIGAGNYSLKVKLDTKYESHYELVDDVTKTLSVDKCKIELTWTDNENLVYDGTDEHKPTLTIQHSAEDCTDKSIINEERIIVSYTKKGTDGNYSPEEIETRNRGDYKATASLLPDDAKNHEITNPEHEFTIAPYGSITLTPIPDGLDALTKVYDNKKTMFSTYTCVPELAEPIKKELDDLLKVCVDAGNSLFNYGSEDVDLEHPHTIVLSEEAKKVLEGSNFDVLQIHVDGTFTITKREITITPDAKQKYYGASDPNLTYVVEGLNNDDFIEGTGITKDEIDKAISDAGGLFKAPGDDVGKYMIDAREKELANFTVEVKENNNFEILPLPVTIHPAEGQGKLFGQVEPTSYPYTVEIAPGLTNLSAEAVADVLGADGLTREPGESVGDHKFQIIPKKSELYKSKGLDNYTFTVPDTPAFTIQPIKIEKVQEINSRQDSFKVTTNLKGERQPGVTTGFKVEIVEYPGSANGVNYSTNIDDYISGATAGVAFTGASDTIKVNAVGYSKERKDSKKLVTWNGYLPAGTKIAVSAVDAEGNQVSSNKETVTVSPVSVSFDWSGFETSAATGNYVTTNKGAANPLSLTGDRTGEWVEIVYNGKAAYYGALNMQFAPTAQNSGSKHNSQSVTANIVDTLNLVCESKSLQFYVDDSAFAIPASSIHFENRGKEIMIELPEQGTLTEVSILGGTVELSGSMGQDFTLPVDWSGKNLIPTGAPISVTYTDQAGHQGSGITAVTRSSVSTPITFQIRPELNGAGYLNGRSDTLIISGTACSCEPIRLTVAGATQTTYATQKDVWSDSNGSWEAMISMSSLPEEQDFTISAEYVDVNGSPYSITAKFDSFCASAAIVSPVYEAMSYISGMVEPNTAVALVVNGDEQNYYEMRVDRFGHFVMDDVPMMFGGEDSFDIYVTDIAGNVSIRHYEVEEPGDPFEVTGSVNPLGKFLYSAAENDSVISTATPVSAADFDKKKTDVKIPLLMGMSYEIGTLTLHRTKNGFTVSKEIKVDKDIAGEDYRFENEKLYLYTSRPSLGELRNAAGQEIAYGAEIPLGEGETVWIATEGSMTILADDIMDLKQFDFENSEEYVKYQEQ